MGTRQRQGRIMDNKQPKPATESERTQPESVAEAILDAPSSVSALLSSAYDEKELSLEDGARLREAAYIQAANRYHLKRLENQLNAVLQIGQTLASTIEPDRILTLLMQKITELMEADRSTLFLVDQKQGEIWSKILQGEGTVQIRMPLGQGIAGWVAQTGETLNLTDAYKHPRFNAEIDRESGYRTRTILTMPLRNQRHEIVGVIQVLNKRGDAPFRDDDEQLLKAIAAQAATFLENAQLYQELWYKHVELTRTSRKLEQRTHELDIVYDIEQQMSGAFHDQEMYTNILNRVLMLLTCEAGTIALFDPKSEHIHYKAVTGLSTGNVNHRKIQLGEGFISWTMKQGEPLLTNDPGLDPRFRPVDFAPLSSPLRSVLCVPLQREESISGAICLLNKRSPKGFQSDDLRILKQVASQISRAVEIGERRKQRLKENRLATIGQLMSGVLHDLKGPMTIISGYAQMLTLQDDPTKRETFANAIMAQIERLNLMTREVLSFARGESTLLLREIKMNQFINDIRDHLTQEFEGSGIVIEIENDYRGNANFDEIKIQRLIYNLARNARQAMADMVGGRVVVSFVQRDDQLAITVSDNGPGIPEEIQSHVFDSFVTGRPKEGSGLGLAIVRKIIDEHQGSIRFESTEGEGTTFFVTLPLEGPTTQNDTN